MIRRRASVAAALVTLAACNRGHTPTPSTPSVSNAEREWPAARTEAMSAGLMRDTRRADSVLRAFAARFPGTPEAAESRYWLAFFLLDPAGAATAPNVSPRVAAEALDAYINGGPSQPHYVEAVLLKRISGHLDSLQATADILRTDFLPGGGRNAPPPTITGVRDTLRARGEEINRLRTELEQTRAELDRIRKRVAPARRPD